jgi:NADPH:quinone reductase-like Zn-dependent oxidoreductase
MLKEETRTVGPPMIRMLRMLGARTIATTRGRGKADAIRGFGADHVIVTGEEDVAARVAGITGGKGVSLVYDAIGGAGVQALAEATAPYGKIVLYGVMDAAPAPLPIGPIIQKNLALLGYAMYLPDRPERNARAMAFIRKGIAAGQLRPLIGKRFPFDRVREAAAYFDTMEQVGKVVVTLDRAGA